MKIYKSTAGCGYNQYAYVTPVRKNKNGGTDYLCLWTNEEESYVATHREGGIVDDLHDIYLEEVELDIDTLPISKTYLFQIFLKQQTSLNRELKLNDLGI
jgi:hypothetical protein